MTVWSEMYYVKPFRKVGGKDYKHHQTPDIKTILEKLGPCFNP